MNADQMELNGKVYKRGSGNGEKPFFYPEEFGGFIYCACGGKAFQLLQIPGVTPEHPDTIEAKCRGCGLQGGI